MYSDTHCHLFSYYKKAEVKALITEINANLSFVQDIGTKPEDFSERISLAKELLGEIPEIYHFSLGIWPDAKYIAEPEKSVKTLEENIVRAKAMGFKVALGECGLDRYWNGEHERKNGTERGTTDIAGEEFLFESQLVLAKKHQLPVIVHSRDAFSDTLKVIDKVGYHNGVIHCYAYGKEEAQAFVERGWYISFSGNCTYPTTKNKADAMAALVESIPEERLLLETDAPYLAPVPHRGEQNTPLLVKHVYETVSRMRAIEKALLCDLVLRNARRLFG